MSVQCQNYDLNEVSTIGRGVWSQHLGSNEGVVSALWSLYGVSTRGNRWYQYYVLKYDFSTNMELICG